MNNDHRVLAQRLLLITDGARDLSRCRMARATARAIFVTDTGGLLAWRSVSISYVQQHIIPFGALPKAMIKAWSNLEWEPVDPYSALEQLARA